MKKLILLLCVALFVCSNIKAEEKYSKINLSHDAQNKEKIDGRSTIDSILQAFYVESSESVLVCFGYPLGAVSVIIENLDTGAYVQDTIASDSGIIILNSPVGNGECIIYFLLTDGTVYVGSFVKCI